MTVMTFVFPRSGRIVCRAPRGFRSSLEIDTGIVKRDPFVPFVSFVFKLVL